MKIWQAISNIGIHFGDNSKARRYIQICNRVSFIIFILVIQLFLIALIYFQWIASTKLALLSAITFLIPPLLNHFGFINASRLLLILLITVPIVIISIIDKFDHPESLEEFEYFQYRVLLLSSSILPFILFSLKEKWQLVFGLLLCLFCLVFYDPLHNLFKAGYYQMGFSAPNYYFLNYMTIYSFFVLTGSTYFLKFSYSAYETENESLIEQLSARQKEILQASELIQQQRENLRVENQNLNQELLIKNNQLIETNQELIRHNNELQQFSYTISHNLKGPVASLTGLLQLIDQSRLADDHREIIKRLTDSVSTLDIIIKDLSNIIDIRNDITRIKQKISLENELNEIKILLKKDIEDHDIKINTFFRDEPYIYSVRPMLHSILYNLVSNGIKYRSMERKPEITIKSSSQPDSYQITVEDNGLGIDMESFGSKLFSLYKRFHLHTEGRGLGLFLVKLQMDALEGKIEVESEIEKGTKFTLTFPKSTNLDEQILLDNKLATMYFNAPLNCIGINWKQSGSIEETKELLKKSIDFIKDYRTINWISNLTRVIEREEEELNKWRRNHRMELKKAGLKRVGLILPQEMVQFDLASKKGFKDVYDVDIRSFSSISEAKKWIESENEKTI